MNLRRELARGTLWTGVGRYGHYLLQLAVTAILSRILSPADFGILSMVVVFTGFINLLAAAGLSATVVQKRDIDDTNLSTVFWFSGIISLALSLMLVLLAPHIEIFFDMPGLSVVTQVMSINILLLGLQSVPKGRLLRNLQFKKLAGIELASYFVAGTGAVLLALMGAGYWSLVIQLLTATSVQLLGYFLVNQWFPRFQFNYSIARDTIAFSSYLLGFNLVNYWARNADNLLIGRALGAAPLGYYNQAYKLMVLPINLVTGVITPSLHPVLATIQDDRQRMSSAYLKLVEFVAFISFPLGVFMLFFAAPIIRVLWGDRWEASIPVFEVLAVLSMMQPVISTSGSVFIASDQLRLLFRLGSFNSAVMVVGILAGLSFGIVGVAFGYAISFLLIVSPVTIYYLGRILDRPLSRVISIFLRPLLMSLALGWLLLCSKWFFDFENDLLRLVCGILAAFVIMSAGAFLLYREQLIASLRQFKRQ